MKTLKLKPKAKDRFILFETAADADILMKRVHHILHKRICHGKAVCKMSATKTDR